jgi:hypothetical protein
MNHTWIHEHETNFNDNEVKVKNKDDISNVSNVLQFVGQLSQLYKIIYVLIY